MTQPKIDHFEAVRGPDNAPGTGPNDSITQATIDGASAYVFTVRPGDVQPWDTGNIGSNGKPNERAEISYAPAPSSQKANSTVNVREGMTQTYDVDYRFKAGFPPHVAANREWAVLTQFHVQDDHRAGVPNGFGGATVHDGKITFDDPMGSGNYFATIPIVPDTWIKIRMAVKWSAGNDGYAVIQDRATGRIIGRYSGRTITAGEFKYVKQGYYRAGGLPEGTVYQSSPGGPGVDISDGDLTMATSTGTGATTPSSGTTTPPAPTPAATTPANFDPTQPSVNPNAGAKQLMLTRDTLMTLIQAMQDRVTAINGLLSQGGYRP